VEQLTANKMLSNSVRGQELADESHTETLNRQVNQAGTGAPPRPSLTLAQLQDIQSECMADDIEIDLAKMAFWTAEEAVAYFESGGEVEPPPKPTPPPEPAPPEPAPPDPVPAAPSEPETPPEAEPPPEPEPAPRLVKKWSSAFFFSEEAAVRREALAAERLTSGEGEASLPANGGGGVFQMPDSGAAEEDEELTVEEGVAAFSAAILESARLVPDAELPDCGESSTAEMAAMMGLTMPRMRADVRLRPCSSSCLRLEVEVSPELHDTIETPTRMTTATANRASPGGGASAKDLSPMSAGTPNDDLECEIEVEELSKAPEQRELTE